MKKAHLATVFASLAAASLVGVAVQQSVSADVSSGDRPVLIQITPCRLADTRPGPNNVGPRSGPLGPGAVQVFDTQASGTDCTGQIPSDAVGIATNITALGATEQSFFTVWGGGAQPLASSLNPAPGEPPTPNGVATPLDGGTFRIYNESGQAHAVVDVVGYYINHNHDDLYAAGNEPTTVSVGAAAFDSWEANFGWQKNLANGVDSGGAWITSNPHGIAVPGLAAPVQLPDGATITGATAYFTDDALTTSLNIQIRCELHAGGVEFVAQGDTVASPSSGQVDLTITPTQSVVDNSRCSYFAFAESGSWASVRDDLKIRGVSIELS